MSYFYIFVFPRTPERFRAISCHKPREVEFKTEPGGICDLTGGMDMKFGEPEILSTPKFRPKFREHPSM